MKFLLMKFKYAKDGYSMSRVPAFRRLCFVFVSVILIVSFVFAETPKKTGDRGEEDKDSPAERLYWFLSGRLPADGSAPAEKMVKGYQHKMRLRAQRAAELRQRLQSGAASSNVVGGQSTVWTPIGPAPLQSPEWGNVSGRVAAVAVDPSDATGNTVYVGGATGGAWKSTNAANPDPSGVVWTTMTDDRETTSVGAIAVSPNGNTILVGTGEAKSALDAYYGRGILRSTDRGQTWTLITNANGGNFFGIGFAKIAFNTENPDIVVAATTSTPMGIRTGTGTPLSGLYYSLDGGASWTRVTNVTDSGITTSLSAAHSVVYNKFQHKFYAQYRFHGLYQSSDGVNWTRMTAQPDNSYLNKTNCPASTSSNCPIYRAEMAVHPTRDELYVWWVEPTTSTLGNHGVWLTKDGGATWTGMDTVNLNLCGDSAGCGISQAYFYDMALAAVPNPTNGALTDIYVGEVNLYKCTLDPADASPCKGTYAEPNRFMNITHVYSPTCGWGDFAKVHPDQHAIAYHPSAPNIIYFGNDGGIFRTLTSKDIHTGTCGQQPAGGMPFDSLNATIGAMTQFVWATPHPSDPTGYVAGAQDNGSSLTSSTVSGRTSTAYGNSFGNYRGGDGGYNAIRTDIGTPEVFYSSYVYADITSCNNGFTCTEPDNIVVQNSDIGDQTAFYVPWLLDPYSPSRLILGGCRVWIGNSNPGATATYSGWTLSQKLNNASGFQNCNGDALIYALAAGGPKSDKTNTAKVLYASVYAGGLSQIWMTAAGDVPQGSKNAVWANVSPTALNPNSYRINGLTIDKADPTGLTVYAAIQGFGSAHVIKSTDGGQSWADITGDLPDAPANALEVDPDDHNVVYVATDLGVFVTSNNGTNWTEVGPTLPGASGASGYLPNVPVLRVAFSKPGSKKLLMAATYGRGIFTADLTPDAPFVTLDKTSWDFGNVNVGTSSSKAITLTNIGTQPLTISSIVFGGANSNQYQLVNNDCPASPSTLAVGANCTFTVNFNPTQIGNGLVASISITDDATGSPHIVSLTGNGAAVVLLDPATLAFGNQRVGTTSAAGTVTLNNTGATTLNVSGVAISAPYTQTGGTCPTTVPFQVAGNSNCTFLIAFAPTSSGATQNASITITDDSVGSPHSVMLSGTGTQSLISLSSNSLSFGSLAINKTSAAQTITVTNGPNATATLNIGTVTISGQFTKANDNCSGKAIGFAAPNNTCTIQVSFAPTTTGLQSGDLSIPSDAAVAAATVTFSGTGMSAANANVTPALLDWGKVNVNSSPANKTFTITNTGEAPLNITSIANVGFTAEYTVTHNCGNMPASLAANATCTVTQAFHPTAAGTHDATVVVTSDSDGTAGTQSTVQLKGTGEDFSAPTVANTSMTIAKGGSANFGTVTIPAAGGFSSAITMSCTGLPAGAQCVFNPNPIPAPNAGSATTQLTITTATSTTVPVARGEVRKPLLAVWLVMPSMALLLPGVIGQRQRKWLVRLMVLAMSALVLVSMTACGGNSNSNSTPKPNPSTSYTVTVTATSGNLSHSTNVTLTVQ